MYDVTIYIYALSVLMYFSDFIQSNRKVNQRAFWLLAIVWVLQSIFFVSQMLTKDYFPILTLFETLFFYSWIMVSLSLTINYFFKMDFLVFFTNIIGFAVMAVTLFANPAATPALSKQLISELLFIHISLAFFSYGAFSVSFILSIMYLVQNKMLKQKKWTPLFRRLPSLGQLDLYAYRLAMVGVPTLLLAVILGVIWAHVVGQPLWFDPKVLMSLLVIGIYSIYLYRRITYDWQGRKLAILNVVAFCMILINYFVSGSLSSFHQWLR
ncbi:inner membrane protein YpjD [Ammoniphilus sp. CFH 90114]|uniref:cytochrome C assembly family protein n=1 Tax=Ammoniphilus sp. CFH 90114 TaxID=2493665 RepID=UPI00100E9500|nr:cytochrome c biogenesis protein CcsA [Ammoniphilus sp. CFH 90114]RXT15489.1 cytochrome C assembly protein [Ammoniphilus sp. CFH 90114]